MLQIQPNVIQENNNFYFLENDGYVFFWNLLRNQSIHFKLVYNSSLSEVRIEATAWTSDAFNH